MGILSLAHYTFNDLLLTSTLHSTQHFDKKGILLQLGSHLHACVYRFQHNVNRKHESRRNPSGN